MPLQTRKLTISVRWGFSLWAFGRIGLRNILQIIFLLRSSLIRIFGCSVECVSEGCIAVAVYAEIVFFN